MSLYDFATSVQQRVWEVILAKTDQQQWENQYHFVVVPFILANWVFFTVVLFLIRCNPPREAELLLDVSTPWVLVRSLRKNRETLEKVSVRCAFGDYSESELLTIFKEVAALPALKIMHAELVLRVHALQALFQQAQKLEELFVFMEENLDTSPKEMKALTESLQQHQHLRRLQLEFYSEDDLADNDNDTTCDLSPLFYTLAFEVPTLRDLTIAGSGDPSLLLQSPHLVRLDIPSPLKGPKIAHLETSQLQELVACLALGTATEWVRVLEKTNLLRKLTLIVSGEEAIGELLSVLADLVAKCTLNSLTISLRNLPEDDDHCDRIPRLWQILATALETNTSLTEFTLNCPQRHVCVSVWNQLSQVVRNNYSLQDIQWQCPLESELQRPPGIQEAEFYIRAMPSSLQFYLHMNRLGRKQLLQGRDNSTLLHVLSCDLDASFYLLTQKPELFCGI